LPGGSELSSVPRLLSDTERDGRMTSLSSSRPPRLPSLFFEGMVNSRDALPSPSPAGNGGSPRQLRRS